MIAAASPFCYTLYDMVRLTYSYTTTHDMVHLVYKSCFQYHHYCYHLLCCWNQAAMLNVAAEKFVVRRGVTMQYNKPSD